MKIGILGTGNVGRALARGFLTRGHAIMFGTRDPEGDKAAELVHELGGNVHLRRRRGRQGHRYEILTAFGWSTIDLGGIECSRYLEPLAMIWIVHGFRTGTWDHAFKLLQR